MKEIRCCKCGKKLAEGTYIELSIKCDRCKFINNLKAMSLPTGDRHGQSDNPLDGGQAASRR